MYVRDTQIIFDISMWLTFLHMSRITLTMGCLASIALVTIYICDIIARVKPHLPLVSKLCNRWETHIVAVRLILNDGNTDLQRRILINLQSKYLNLQNMSLQRNERLIHSIYLYGQIYIVRWVLNVWGSTFRSYILWDITHIPICRHYIYELTCRSKVYTYVMNMCVRLDWSPLIDKSYEKSCAQHS